MRKVTLSGLQWEVDELNSALKFQQAAVRATNRELLQMEEKYKQTCEDVRIYKDQVERLKFPERFKKPQLPEAPWTESDI